MVVVFQEEPFCTPTPFFTIKDKMAILIKKWYPGGIQMVHTVVLYCQTLDKDLNNYANKLFAARSTTFSL